MRLYDSALRKEAKTQKIQSQTVRKPSITWASIPLLFGGVTMKRTTTFLAAIGFCAACSTAYALYSVSATGEWPKSWPSELEPLRKQSRTLVGPLASFQHHAIPFTKREEFEAAWPHILKAKTKGAPVFLLRGPNFFLDNAKAGVIVHCPPEGQNKNPATPEAPIEGVKNPRERWTYTNYIDLVVDGEIVDLNRIPLPPDTPIIDERFKDAEKKEPAAGPGRERPKLGFLLEHPVREAKVIVLATATRSEPAPPNVPGDGPEKFIYLKVVRVLKGELADKTITVRTRDGEEANVGKEWIILLSADNLAKKHFFSAMFTADVEAEVKEIVARIKK